MCVHLCMYLNSWTVSVLENLRVQNTKNFSDDECITRKAKILES